MAFDSSQAELARTSQGGVVVFAAVDEFATPSVDGAQFVRQYGNPAVELMLLDERAIASRAVCSAWSSLGAQAGETRLREVFEQAGYTRFRRAPETPVNLILEAGR